MPTPAEHKTVQAHIFAYVHEIGWSFVSGEEAERRRGLTESEFFSPLGSSSDAGQECPRSVILLISLPACNDMLVWNLQSRMVFLIENHPKPSKHLISYGMVV